MQSLLTKDAIGMVENVMSLGFSTSLFLVSSFLISRKMEASHRPKHVKHAFVSGEFSR